MKILYVDTTSNYLYTGVVENNEILGQVKKRFDHELSTMALATIVDMLNDIDVKPNDIEKIILVNGPGSFTGCRIGITIAKVYSWALNIPISLISSLEAMSTIKTDCDFVVPILDARREYVYSGIYDNKGNSILKDQYVKKSVIETAINNMSDNFIYITNDDIDLDGDVVKYDPDILEIVNRYKERENVNPHGIDANYLKLTEAEEKLNNGND